MKKTVGYLAIAGALSFGIIGGVGIPAFAATNTQQWISLQNGEKGFG